MNPTIHLVTSENLDIFQKSIWSNVSRVTPLCGVVKDSKSVNYLPTNQPTKQGARSPIELLWKTQKYWFSPTVFFNFVLQTSCILLVTDGMLAINRRQLDNLHQRPTDLSTLQNIFSIIFAVTIPLKPYCCSECEQNKNHIAKHFINHICSHNSSKTILLLWMWAESKSHCKTFYQSDLQSHFPLKPYCCSECEQNQDHIAKTFYQSNFAITLSSKNHIAALNVSRIKTWRFDISPDTSIGVWNRP